MNERSDPLPPENVNERFPIVNAEPHNFDDAKEARDFAPVIIEQIPLPLVVIDQDFKVRFTNAAFTALAGISRPELARRFLPDLTAALWGMDQLLRTALNGLRSEPASKRSFAFEHSASGEFQRQFLVRGRMLQLDDGLFVLVTFEDRTARNELDREMEKSEHELRALTGSLLQAQEEERRRVARELHDEVSQRLALLEMDANELADTLMTDPASTPARLETLRGKLSQLSDEVRLMSHRLHPSVLDDLGLVPALRALIKEFGEREQILTTFTAADLPESQSPELTDGLYRITQEALRNVSRHAGKTQVQVSIACDGEQIRLLVIDFGVGFDPDNERKGLGLLSMQERARLIGAEFTIKSAPGKGTEVQVMVPLSD